MATTLGSDTTATTKLNVKTTKLDRQTDILDFFEWEDATKARIYKVIKRVADQTDDVKDDVEDIRVQYNELVGDVKDLWAFLLDAVGSSSSSGVNKLYVDNAVAGVVSSAPATLDTLNELAAALGDDDNYATSTTTAIATKLTKTDNLSDLDNSATALTNLGVTLGWHHSATRVKLFPSDIVPSDGSSTYNISVFDWDSKHGVRPMSSSLDMYIYKEIPSGFKAVSVTINAYHKLTSDSTVYTVYEGYLDDTNSVSKGTSTKTGVSLAHSETIDITDFNSTDNNMIVIHIDNGVFTYKFYGGYVTIAAI